MDLTIILIFVTLNLICHSKGHSAIVAVNGVGGPTGIGIGVVPTTPRNGSDVDPFQQDSSIIRDQEIRSGNTGPCGRTLGGGNNDILKYVSKLISDLGSLPQVAPGQPLKLTIHQVDEDGAGPYKCEMSQNGNGTDFQAIEITQNLGVALGSNFGNRATSQPLVVNMPAVLQCTGGPNKNMCIVRCRNGAPNGPYGGCVAVQEEALLRPTTVLNQPFNATADNNSTSGVGDIIRGVGGMLAGVGEIIAGSGRVAGAIAGLIGGAGAGGIESGVQGIIAGIGDFVNGMGRMLRSVGAMVGGSGKALGASPDCVEFSLSDVSGLIHRHCPILGTFYVSIPACSA